MVWVFLIVVVVFLQKTVKYGLWRSESAADMKSKRPRQLLVKKRSCENLKSVLTIASKRNKFHLHKSFMQHLYYPFAIWWVATKLKERTSAMYDCKVFNYSLFPVNVSINYWILLLPELEKPFYDFISFSIIYLLFANKLIFLCSRNSL